MDYQRIHDQIIGRYYPIRDRREAYELYGYVETHHRIPRCLGGSDDPENLVHLPARVHFIVHMLLTRIYPDNEGLWWAAHRMSCSGVQDYKVTARNFDTIKKNLARLGRSDQVKEKISASLTGRILGPHSEEHRNRISASHKGKTVSERVKTISVAAMVKANQERIRSPEENRKRGEAISKALKARGLIPYVETENRKAARELRTGVRQSEETCQKKRDAWIKRKESGIGNGSLGQKRSKETKEKMSNSAKKPKSEAQKLSMKNAQIARRLRESLLKSQINTSLPE